MEKFREYEEEEEINETEQKLETKNLEKEMPKNYQPDLETINAISNSEHGRVEIKEQNLKAETKPLEDLTDKDFEDIGMQDVPLDQIDLSGSRVRGPEDFRNASYEQVCERIDKLENVIKPTVEQGADLDYFRSLDHNHGPYVKEGGYVEAYNSFYGSKPIDLYQESEGGAYKVGNDGFHRLFAAKEMGLKSVPARVKVARS